MLWVYLGAPSSKPLLELPWIPGACEPDRHGATTEAVWNARFSRVMDAHRRYAPPGYTRLDPYEVRVEDGLIRTRGWLRKQAAAPGTGLRFEIHIRWMTTAWSAAACPAPARSTTGRWCERTGASPPGIACTRRGTRRAEGRRRLLLIE